MYHLQIFIKLDSLHSILKALEQCKITQLFNHSTKDPTVNLIVSGFKGKDFFFKVSIELINSLFSLHCQSRELNGVAATEGLGEEKNVAKRTQGQMISWLNGTF